MEVDMYMLVASFLFSQAWFEMHNYSIGSDWASCRRHVKTLRASYQKLNQTASQRTGDSEKYDDFTWAKMKQFFDLEAACNAEKASKKESKRKDKQKLEENLKVNNSCFNP